MPELLLPTSERWSPVPEEPTIDVTGLTAGYGGPPIIQDINLQVMPGALTAVVGSNGAGKSTLLKAISGVIRPTSGEVRLCGEVTTGIPAHKMVQKGIAYVPQVANVFPSLTVSENLEMGGYTRGGRLRARMDEMYEMFPDLRSHSRRPARVLSGGQRNMLALARGLMTDPKILIVDEPTAGLAPMFVSAVWHHIRQVRASGVSVLVVEQNTRRTLTEADWGYVLNMGRNRLSGPASQLLNDEEVVELYIGRKV